MCLATQWAREGGSRVGNGFRKQAVLIGWDKRDAVAPASASVPVITPGAAPCLPHPACPPQVNDASKPIPSGLITPDRALLVSTLVYICLLALTCVVPNTGLRVGVE